MARRISLLEWLALELSRTGVASFAVDNFVAYYGRAHSCQGCAVSRVGIRPTSGRHRKQHQHGGRQSNGDGPYRYMRNPLYIGLWCMVIAMAFLMPAHRGSIFRDPHRRSSPFA